MRLEFTIFAPPITKKNHSQIIKVNGRPMLIPSKEYRQYEKDVAPFMPKLNKPIDFPVNVQAVFYKNTKRQVDLPNLIACLHDVLVKYGVVADDCREIIYAVDGSRVFYDKQNPRTEVLITSIPEEEFEAWK